MSSSEAAHEATLAKWRRRKELADETGEIATEAVQGIFKKMLRNKEQRRSIAKDIVRMSKGEASKFKGNETGSLLRGYDDPGLSYDGTPTGVGEYTTWTGEEEDLD